MTKILILFVIFQVLSFALVGTLLIKYSTIQLNIIKTSKSNVKKSKNKVV